jgi:hypothetical protein
MRHVTIRSVADSSTAITLEPTTSWSASSALTFEVSHISWTADFRYNEFTVREDVLITSNCAEANYLRGIWKSTALNSR